MIEALKRVALFEDLGDEDLAALAAIVVGRGYAKNAVIVSAGDASDSLYLIVSGRLKI